MTAPPDISLARIDRFAALRREFALVVDARGAVIEADQTAQRVLGLVVGQSLNALAGPGNEDKLRRLISTAAARMVVAWEVHLIGPSGDLTIDFNGSPDEAGGALLIGSLVADSVATTAAALGDALSEMMGMQRESVSQRRELERQHTALRQSTHQLEESHAGMTVVYAELEASSALLREAGASKSRFFANANHELKTPLVSIIALSDILLSKADGELSAEQAKQIGFIRQSAQTLNTLVIDVLDLARNEAGRVAMNPARFTVTTMLAVLRGMLRPLAMRAGVELVVEDPPVEFVLDTDEGRLAQIIRNLVSNALKFTERGEVRVSTVGNADGTITFRVRDTGIGIPVESHALVFEEFEQVRGPLQVAARGAGLGLTLSRQLAALLGGTIALESVPGVGSTFSVTVPRVHAIATAITAMATRASIADPARLPVLFVDDDASSLIAYERQLEGSSYRLIPARSISAARAVLARVTPAAIVLDVMFEAETSWNFLTELKREARTARVPVIVATVLMAEGRARASGADEFAVKPLAGEWLLRRLTALSVAAGTAIKLLVIDDDETHRYVVRRMVVNEPVEVLEAADGPEGITAAGEWLPNVILLDVVMPTMAALEVLQALKRDPRTRHIPVLVNSAKSLTIAERARLMEHAVDVFSKASLTPEVLVSHIRRALENAAARAPVAS